MIVKQFHDEDLAHNSYVIISINKAIVIDPERNPEIYYNFVEENNAKIIGVIETHPHADFVSSHLEISKTTGADIYVSSDYGAGYKHKTFDEGDEIILGNVKLKSLNTPGHSPDSITVVLEDKDGKIHSLFTGDTLFIGDVGRPDLRENVGNIKAARKELAEQMYYSTRNKIMNLQKEAVILPAHSSGSLCGKALSDELFDTLGNQLKINPALQEMSKEQFLDYILEGQPFIPKYFPYNVNLNKEGAPNFAESIAKVNRLSNIKIGSKDILIDTRPEQEFKQSHIIGAINLQNDIKFESWLGSIVGPDENFILYASNETELEELIRKTAKIGYESKIKAAVLNVEGEKVSLDKLDLVKFDEFKNQYTIVDIRNESEFQEYRVFDNSINIPLHQLREKSNEIPVDKPVIVHCKGGYRSSAGTSIIHSALYGKTKVYDLSTQILNYMN